MLNLLEQVIAAHGGRALWQSVETLSARLSFGGLAFASRFKLTGRKARRVEISTREPKTLFHDYPRSGQRGIFTPDRVWIESDNKALNAELIFPRAAFRAFRRKIRWDHLDLLYFAGYACWNYFTTPFLLAADGVETEEIGQWPENGETWRRLKAHFPKNIPTHCREQIFCFDERFRLRRFDYDPEVYAPWAKAAHFCEDYRNFSGLLIPTKRKVLPRTAGGGTRPKPTLVWIDVQACDLKYGHR